ncbi:MAG TPA: carboxymuconolactone decarboxylase family protein [Solirubrobacterales bacterium]|nr:carboxymuconolactone decarboxylase family protein [Solirubrobacterales bacterium]
MTHETQRTDAAHWTDQGTPRIPPATRRELHPLMRPVVRISGRAVGGKPPHIITTLARHPKLLMSWLVFGGRLMPRGRLHRAETELVILRVAWNNRCRYEWDHHVRIGKRAGLTDADIERIGEGPDAEGWSESQRALLRACDEFHADGRVGDDTWAQLADHFDQPNLIELTMLIGHYEMLAGVIATLGIRPEALETAARPG